VIYTNHAAEPSGYVPVPQSLMRPEEPAADANALPPANAWGNFGKTIVSNTQHYYKIIFS